MRSFIGAFAAVLATLLLADSLWLRTMLPFYQRSLGGLLAPTPDLTAAGLFYLLYAIGVVALVVRPAARPGPVGGVAARGALFGLVAYGTYDLTNQATLAHWSPALTLVDMAWGCALTAAAGTAGGLIVRWRGGSRAGMR